MQAQTEKMEPGGEPIGCKYCGLEHFLLVRQPLPQGSHVKALCAHCRKYLQFVPQGEAGQKRPWRGPQSPVRLETRMPFGKHKGTKIGDLPGEYLQWGSENLENESFRKAFEEALRERA